MATFSNYLENKLIDFILRGQPFTPPTTVYVGLLANASTDVGPGTELSGGSYARVPVASSMVNWSGTQGPGTTAPSNGTGGTISNNIDFTWPTPSANWGVAYSVAIFDAASGGNLLIYGMLDQPKTINAFDAPPAFPATALAFQIDN